MERIRRKLVAIEEADIPQVSVTAQSLASHGLTGKLKKAGYMYYMINKMKVIVPQVSQTYTR